MERILHYFPKLSDTQRSQFEQLEPLYRDWNSKINVISRKDIDHIYLHHVLHSLAIARLIAFKPGASIVDLGTGGGFPGIPLAILFPETNFTLIDGTQKKIRVVEEVAAAIGLANVTPLHVRAEEIKQTFDFVVTRAVAPLPQLKIWSIRLLSRKQQHSLPNGLIALKGGNIKEEIKALPRGEYVEVYPVNKFFTEPYFAEKCIVYVQG